MLGDRRRGEIARNLLKVRAVRTSLFPSELFDEHAWNMLLHLFSALTENETISEEDLIQQSSESTAVGRRWLAHLVKDGQIEARENGDDVRLTPSAVANMRIFLDQANDIHGTPLAF